MPRTPLGTVVELQVSAAYTSLSRTTLAYVNKGDLAVVVGKSDKYRCKWVLTHLLTSTTIYLPSQKYFRRVSNEES